MLNTVTSEQVTLQDFLPEYPGSGTSPVMDAELNELVENILSMLATRTLSMGPRLYAGFRWPCEVDLASVSLHYEFRNETSSIQETVGLGALDEMLEFDVVVHMSPVKEYTARLKVTSREKAIPRIVEPEAL